MYSEEDQANNETQSLPALPYAISLAIVGATGLVGEALIERLEELEWPVERIALLASEHSKGEERYFDGQDIILATPDGFDFSEYDYVILATPKDAVALYREAIQASGACVIDLSGQTLLEGDAPLLTLASPDERLQDFRYAGGVVVPHPVINMLYGALAALKDYSVNTVDVTTYEAASGFGKRALGQLNEQTARVLNGLPVAGRQSAFTTLPMPSSQNEELAFQLARLLGGALETSFSRARVPVFHGHVLAVSVVLSHWVDTQTIIDALNNQPHYVYTADGLDNTHKDSDQTAEHIHVFNVEAGAAEGEFTFWLRSDSVAFCAVETTLGLLQRLTMAR